MAKNLRLKSVLHMCPTVDDAMGTFVCIMLRIHLIELLSKSQGLLIWNN